MASRSFTLVHDTARERAAQACKDAPHGWRVVISEPTKKREQEERYHAMIGDIASQTEYAGRSWDKEDMKRILVDEFDEEMRLAGTPLRHTGRLIPSENGRRLIQLGVQTRHFTVREAWEFISFLSAWGDERGVVWSEKAAERIEAPRRRQTEEA